MEQGEQPKRKENKFWEVWIAKENDKTLAICGLYSITPFDVSTLWLGWFGVLPELRNSNIGSEILNQLKEKAKEVGATKLMSYVDEDGKPLNFYKRHGFNVIDTVGNYVKSNSITMTDFEDENDYVIQHTL